jgi:hypothetical protein
VSIWPDNDAKPRYDSGVAVWTWKAAQDNLLAAIADPHASQRDIAGFYSDALFVAGVDWPTVNRAILSRYKPSGLARIKQMAWRMAERRERHVDGKRA